LEVLGIAPGQTPATISTLAQAPATAAVLVERLLPGDGLPAQLGDRVTLHFVVRTLDGKELANTFKRGMPYTVELADPDSLWYLGVESLRTGGRSRVRGNSSQLFGKFGVLPIVGPDTELEAELTLLRIQKAALARRTP
jgi:FKBP-type peptidyl-prolyl cis-trans isomerase